MCRYDPHNAWGEHEVHALERVLKLLLRELDFPSKSTIGLDKEILVHNASQNVQSATTRDLLNIKPTDWFLQRDYESPGEFEKQPTVAQSMRDGREIVGDKSFNLSADVIIASLSLHPGFCSSSEVSL